MKLSNEQFTELANVLGSDAAARVMGEALAIRRIECVEQAAIKLFGNNTDSWREQVDVSDPNIREKVATQMNQLGYPIKLTMLEEKLAPSTAGLMQELFIFATWLEKNPCRSHSGPIFKKHAEYKGLLYMSAAEFGFTLGVRPTNPKVNEQQAVYAYQHIRKPSQSARFQ